MISLDLESPLIYRALRVPLCPKAMWLLYPHAHGVLIGQQFVVTYSVPGRAVALLLFVCRFDDTLPVLHVFSLLTRTKDLYPFFRSLPTNSLY